MNGLPVSWFFIFGVLSLFFPPSSKEAAGRAFRDCADCPEMVAIPAGSFTMGAAPGEVGSDAFEVPQRKVDIRKFAVGKFDVTRGRWAAFVKATNRATTNGCAWASAGNSGELDPKASWRNLDFEQDDDHPVVCVSWGDAQDYVRWLSKKAGHEYRLLTEAEWEYAARAGTSTPYPWGKNATHEQANYGADECCSGLASGRDRWVKTSPVGSFPANDFGLYDMHGNVLQWVQDCFSDSYLEVATDGSAYEKVVKLKTKGPSGDMAGTSSCAYRMLRGGDWGDPSSMIRSAFRNYAPPEGATIENYRSGGAGFRVARSLD